MKVEKLTILIPVYNEQECLEMLYQRLVNVADKLEEVETEFLFVNDGSRDDSLQIIKRLQRSDKRVALLDLSRNFGKEVAMTAGIDYATGDALVIIDADLQDPPELIGEMLKGIEDGYDDVYAKRSNRKGETWMKKSTSKLYYRMLKKISDIPVQEDTGDYRMFSKRAIDALRRLKENERNMKGLFSFIGFKKKPIYYERDPRIAGKTKWNYWKLVNLAAQGFMSTSKVPLRLISIMGIFVSLIAFLYLIFVVVRAAIWGDPVSGYPSMVSIILFLGGGQMLALGIIGEYLGIVFSETKKRPIYYVNEYSTGDVAEAGND
ncbi:MAG: glycosyltransferase family 2 protein [Bacteroidetes bacterium]|uniref:Glycosyltransferase family 2 protein n=1 Tax=Candidatus Limisoma faecipullorum TaxID=2840854 RepID=A0A9D9IQT0_9BACT|nr:glycosyltransferase family 2 protein [Candidatus Limisoma faecipullorum]